MQPGGFEEFVSLQMDSLVEKLHALNISICRLERELMSTPYKRQGKRQRIRSRLESASLKEGRLCSWKATWARISADPYDGDRE